MYIAYFFLSLLFCEGDVEEEEGGGGSWREDVRVERKWVRGTREGGQRNGRLLWRRRRRRRAECGAGERTKGLSGSG